MHQQTPTHSAASVRRLALAAMLLAAILPSFAAPPDVVEPKANGTGVAIDLNTATAKQLQAVPGIGPATAARIVAFRTEHGPFRRVEDLVKVRGIGETTFQKIRRHVRVSGDG